MFVNQQIGVIVDVVEPKKNFYSLRLVDTGTVVTAIPLQQSRGATTRFTTGDQVLASYAAGAWFISGLIPKIALNESTAPRLASMAPGDVFHGNAATSAGLHVTGGLTTVEAAGFDGSGKPRRAASTAWVPDADAIMNLCRRFGLNGAPGDVQMLHDDLTGNTALRLWVRGSSITGLNGRTSRIHMGYHRDPVGATLSIVTFPVGPDPVANLKVPDFKMDPEVEIQQFAGQWPKLERQDWNSRYYVMLDGTTIYENALVPVPSITPTTSAQAINRVTISPLGIVSFVGNTSSIAVSALSNLITLKTTYAMSASTSASITSPFINMTGDSVTLGQPASAIALCNLKLFTWAVSQLLTFLVSHTHISSSPGSPTSPATQTITPPDSTMVTTNTWAS